MTMDTDRMVEPLGAMVTELQAALRARGYPDAIVRGGDLQGTDTPGAVDGTATGLVLLRRNGGAPRRRVGVQDLRVTAQCFAPAGRKGAQEAAYLANTVTAWFHDRGPRRGSGRRVLFSSAVVSQGTPTTDPDTHWPTETLVITAMASVVPLPA
jgi:hypothetical protein